MVRGWPFSLVLGLACLGFGAQARADTISDTVSRALHGNPTVQAAQAGQRAAEHEVRITRSEFFPTIRVEGAFGAIDADDDTTRARTGGSADSWRGDGSVTVNQKLFEGFNLFNRYDASKSRASAGRFEADDSANSVAMQAIRAHLNVMRARDLLAAARQFNEDARGYRNGIASMVSEGAIDEAELLRADDLFSAADATRLEYEGLLRAAQADYIQVVGGPALTTLDIGVPKLDSRMPDNVKTAIRTALANHPSLRAASRMEEAYDHEVSAERATISPKFGTEVSYFERDQDEDVGGEIESAQALVRMTWEFQTGGAYRHRVRKKLEQREEARARFDERRRQVERDIRNNFHQMQIAGQQLSRYLDRERTNEQIIEKYRAQYEGGMRTLLQIINAQNHLFAARADRINSYYRRLLAKFEVLAATGTLREALSAENIMPSKPRGG